ncbi:MAG: serine/threonine protein phosphatase [Planctomyces sp.]|nr:serine/threonine protein phosphatase [Planctomyces sp.]
MPHDTDTSGRLLAIGDIHGCDVALHTLLRALKLTKEDTVVILGDVVDRGPNTRRCLDILLDLREECRLVHLMGNHEEMFLDALQGGRWSNAWLQNGGDEMLASYGGEFDNIPSQHLDFLRSGRDYYETELDIFVHATPHFDTPMDEQSGQSLRWNRITGREPPHCSGKRVICGHTSQRGGVPLVFMGWVCLDTNVYGDRGALSALDVLNDEIYQAEQSGRFRGRFPLAAFELARRR